MSLIFLSFLIAEEGQHVFSDTDHMTRSSFLLILQSQTLWHSIIAIEDPLNFSINGLLANLLSRGQVNASTTKLIWIWCQSTGRAWSYSNFQRKKVKFLQFPISVSHLLPSDVPLVSDPLCNSARKRNVK